MLSSGRFGMDQITVKGENGSRGSDGYTPGAESTVLQCAGNAQSVGRSDEETGATFDEGAIRFFATMDVKVVEPGMDATVELKDGTTLDTTVETVDFTDDSLLLSLD